MRKCRHTISKLCFHRHHRNTGRIAARICGLYHSAYKANGRGILISGSLSFNAGEGGAQREELRLRADSLWSILSTAGAYVFVRKAHGMSEGDFFIRVRKCCVKVKYRSMDTEYIPASLLEHIIFTQTQCKQAALSECRLELPVENLRNECRQS